MCLANEKVFIYKDKSMVVLTCPHWATGVPVAVAVAVEVAVVVEVEVVVGVGDVVVVPVPPQGEPVFKMLAAC